MNKIYFYSYNLLTFFGLSSSMDTGSVDAERVLKAHVRWARKLGGGINKVFLLLSNYLSGLK